ncbi:protein rolling stone-like [Aricia agestis]|uniref:protein rolling stone-like n=1 Tax=Aricia agestis TaxID=91739 RepID=UPI001C20A838|nr:protein rolling stone-like [Aricia agestis]
MVKCTKKTFSFSDLWVSYHERAGDFYLSSWQRGESPIPMFVVRLILAAASVAILVYSLYSGASQFWMIYLTNWGLLFITVITLSGLLVSCIAICTKITDSAQLPWYISLYWLFFNIGATMAIVITGLYWTLLYATEEDVNFWLDLTTHGFNSCIVFVELVASRAPVRLLHVYQPLAVGIWYASFTGIYYAAGGVNGKDEPFIYPVLDWRDGGSSAALVAAAIASLIIVYVVLWAVTVCRDRASRRLVRTTSLDLPLTPPDRHTPNAV